MKRRTFLQGSAALPAVSVADRLSADAAGSDGRTIGSASPNVQIRPELAGMNVVVFITDHVEHR